VSDQALDTLHIVFGLCLGGRLYYQSPFTVEETETQINVKVSCQKHQWRWDLNPSDFALELLKPEWFPFYHVVFLMSITLVGTDWAIML